MSFYDVEVASGKTVGVTILSNKRTVIEIIFDDDPHFSSCAVDDVTIEQLESCENIFRQAAVTARSGDVERFRLPVNGPLQFTLLVGSGSVNLEVYSNECDFLCSSVSPELVEKIADVFHQAYLEVAGTKSDMGSLPKREESRDNEIPAC